jgi:hypothetical protein
VRVVVVKDEASRRYVRREQTHAIGVFLDGVSLDRAARRLNKKVDWKLLVKVISEGRVPKLLRYYTVIPHEDDARHHSFLGAVEGAGFQVIVKRLPPKGINRNVTIDLEMASDIVGFGLGLRDLPASTDPAGKEGARDSRGENKPSDTRTPEKAEIILICPPNDLEYPLRLIADREVKITVVDFKGSGTSELIKVSSKWMDLSDAPIYR